MTIHPSHGVISSSQNFIAHKVKTDDFRSFHRFVKITIDRIPNHCTKIFEILALRMNSIAESVRIIATLKLIFVHLENDFAHGKRVIGPVPQGN